MLGAIAGDIIGSAYEFHSTKNYNFKLFTPRSTPTDDSILTIAVADCILNGKDYAETFKYYGREYPYGGYGGMFLQWLGSTSNDPYNSFGNGSAMRVSPVGFAFDTLKDVLAEAEKSAVVTHNHPEGIKGAQAVAAAIFLARKRQSKFEIKDYIETTFAYDLSRTIDVIRPNYQFDETCQGSVPESIIAFLESESYEDAVRKAVSLGGDADTMGCIAGGIAEAFYGGVSTDIAENAIERLNDEFLKTIDDFYARFRK
jgi:ADP-ribosylglycohydrolase